MVSIAPDAIAALRVPLAAPGEGAVLEFPPPLLVPLVPLVPPLEPHAASATAAAITSAA
jgi:hypothetical protein